MSCFLVSTIALLLGLATGSACHAPSASSLVAQGSPAALRDGAGARRAGPGGRRRVTEP